MPSRGPTNGRNCYTTLAYSGVPNAKRGEQNQKWLPHPCLLGGPKQGGIAMSPLHSRGSPKPSAWKKSEVAASPVPSRTSTRGRNCYVTPAFSGIPNAKHGEQNQKWLPHPCLLGGPKEGGMATSPLHSRGPQRRARGTKSEVAASPLLCRRATRGRNCYVTLAFSGVPKQGNEIRSGYLTLAFSGPTSA